MADLRPGIAPPASEAAATAPVPFQGHRTVLVFERQEIEHAVVRQPKQLGANRIHRIEARRRRAGGGSAARVETPQYLTTNQSGCWPSGRLRRSHDRCGLGNPGRPFDPARRARLAFVVVDATPCCGDAPTTVDPVLSWFGTGDVSTALRRVVGGRSTENAAAAAVPGTALSPPRGGRGRRTSGHPGRCPGHTGDAPSAFGGSGAIGQEGTPEER